MLNETLGKKVRWTKDEKEKFFAGLDLYGKNYEKIVKYIGTKDRQ